MDKIILKFIENLAKQDQSTLEELVKMEERNLKHLEMISLLNERLKLAEERSINLEGRVVLLEG